MNPFCYLCFMSVILPCLFLAVLWSSAGKGLTSWLFCVCVMFSGVVGQVWYLIVSIPDLCILYFGNLLTAIR